MSEESSPAVQSILCEQVDNRLQMARRELAVASLHLGRDTNPRGHASIHLVRGKHLPQIRALGAGIVDCGKKHPARPLAAILLGRDRIPVLDGGFKNAGQLSRSLKALLRNAADADDRNRFVIGVSDVLFEQLWAQVLPDEMRTAPSETATLDRALSFQSLLDIMPQREVPPKLEQMLIGISPQIQFTRQMILQAAQHEGPVLILGDTGTGKDLVARAIHSFSERAEMQFITVNCGAISKDLLESELFGHKKGAFTGAHEDKTGLWLAADRGTLFLDEIGDLPLEHQVKVLRALDANRIRPVGANSEIPVDARVIAATNRDLSAMMTSGQFRADLYYRLRSFLIYTEPLSKHPEDIPLLARHFWRGITRDPKANLSDDIVAILQSNQWIGNVRDLKWTLVSLYRYTSLIDPSPKHLKTVVWYESQREFSRQPLREMQGIDAHRVECLMHLRRTDDALRACEVAVRPLLAKKRPNRLVLDRMGDALRRHSGELEMLCLHPLLFADNKTFKAVERFKCGLIDFLHVVQAQPSKAKDFWAGHLSSRLQEASRAEFRQVDRLVKGK